MDARVWMAVLLALTVVFAGCFGGSGTETPAATATPTGPFDGASPPPGVDSSGVDDVDALLSAHAAALDGQSVTVRQSFTLMVNGSGRNVSLQGKVLPDADRGWMRVGFADGVGTYYTDGDTTYYRERVNGSTTFGTTDEVSAIPSTPRFGADQRIRTAIESAEWEPVGSVERNGETLVELEATSIDVPGVNTTGDTTVSSSGTLLVDSDGVVHYVSVSTTVEDGSGTVQYAIEVSVTDVGSTTVEEPAWIDEAA